MPLDTPARIAVIGAGPIGLEAAIYGRYLGYDVTLFEEDDVAKDVLRRGDASLPLPFGSMSSTLGLAALAAQDESYDRPADEAELSHQAWYDRYLLPLSKTDLLAGNIQTQSSVVTAILTSEPVSSEESDDEDGGDIIELHVQDRSGAESVQHFGALLNSSRKSFALKLAGKLNTSDSFQTGGDDETGATLDPVKSIAELHYFSIGQPSEGTEESWDYSAALADIRQAYAILADRADLDVYQSVAYLLEK